MGSAGSDTYDFIIVGAGASGCTIAWRLANSKSHPRVLLIEAGGKNDEFALKMDGDRWTTRMNPAQNYGYHTTPQKYADNRSIEYDRGKGLGGSTAINFCVFNSGPADDWDEIAKLAGDDAFAWKNAHEALKRLETYHKPSKRIAEYDELVPNSSEHGLNGPLRIGFAKNWEMNTSTIVEVCREAGIPLNANMNSGNPIGVGIAPNSAYAGVRTTAADMLRPQPSNLEVMVDTPVERLVFEGDRCVGVDTGSAKFHASKEVILSAGALDSPRILMHSGIGPADQLKKFGIETRVDSPGLGQTLRDHHHVFVAWERAPGTTDRLAYYQNPELQAAAKEQWLKDQTGPLADYGTTLAIGWLKSKEVLESAEFAALPQASKDHLNKPTIPHYEIAFGCADIEYFMDPANAPPLFSVCIFLMNPQSTGTVTLQSADPKEPLAFDPNFFAHPYDSRVAIEAVRGMFGIAKQPGFAKETVKMRMGPASESDEDIMAYWRGNNGSTWHMSSTTPLGKPGQPGAVVDNQFKIIGGPAGLRVADQGVCPIMTNCHTQGPAYILGLIAADKLVKEYNLD